MTGPLRERLITAIRATPEPPYPSDGAEDVADALLPVVASWGWLMELLAEHYPPDVFPGGPDADPGPQIVALTREVDRRYPRRCSQCGQRWADRACGPTHALITEELGVGDLRREAVRLQDLRIGLAELLGYSSDVAEHMADNVLLETAATVIRGVRS